MSDKVRCMKMTTAAFEALSSKRADTLYFVNATGDFDPQSMNENDGDIYLGDKLLTGKGAQKAFPAYHPGPRASVDRLPEGLYQPLESAYNNNQSTRIDTGIAAYNDDVEFHIRFKQTQNGIYMRLFGADTGGSLRYRLGFVALTTGGITLCCRSTTGALTSAITRTKDHVYTLVGKLKDGSISLYVKDETDGTSDYQEGAYDVDTGYAPEIRLFYLSNQNAYQASGTHVYGAKLKVKGKTVMNYVPAKRKADDEVGFVDTVTGTFKGAATGTWNAGGNADGDAFVVSADPPDIPVFTYGSDTTPPVPGQDGLVPSPTYAGRLSFLRGDGTWQTPPSPSVMGGATSQAEGSQGLVPAPPAGSNDEKYLRGDGTWAYPRTMYGTCTQGASTAAKKVDDLSGPFELVGGAVVFVKFSNTNSASSPTLNVMGTGAKPIKRYGSTAPGTSSYLSWNAGSVQCLVYDGTNERWMLLGWLNTAYSDFAGSSHGLVPASTSSDQGKFLRGDGSWQPMPTRMMQVVATENTDWVPYGNAGYLDAGGCGSSLESLSLGNFLANDRFELTVGLTVGNTDKDNPRHVLFRIELCSSDPGTVVAVLASTIVSMPPCSGDINFIASASLSVLRFVTTDDIQYNRYIRIYAKEVSTSQGMSVRFYNTVQDFSGGPYQKASAYTAKVWRNA